MPTKPAVSKKTTGKVVLQGHTQGEFGNDPMMKSKSGTVASEPKELRP